MFYSLLEISQIEILQNAEKVQLKKMEPQFNHSEKHKIHQVKNIDFDDQLSSEQNLEHTFGWEWYEPPQDSAPVRFCLDTSLHGLRYLGQRKRHMCERLFWFSAFVAAVITALASIWHMWNGCVVMPIVTVFNPSELSLEQIPFPAVTICSVNNIQKSKMVKLRQKADEGFAGKLPEKEFLHILANYLDIYQICKSTQTFTDRFAPDDDLFDQKIQQAMRDRRQEYKSFLNPIETLQNFSQSCKDMILFCVWLDKAHDCAKLFQETQTDYGYCCTFNTIPLALLMNNYIDHGIRDDPEIIETWKQADVDIDNLIATGELKNKREYPRRQKYPGRGGGLSILLEPDLDEYFCTNTDSEGYIVSINVPLDFPRMRDNGIAIGTNKEVFINVNPEITMSDDSIKKFSLEKRKCYFSDEFKLPHYTKYTTSNCMDECIAVKTNRTCGCLRYYMPRGKEDEKMCKPDKYNCTEAVREEVVANGLEKACRECLATCTEIVYNTEITSLDIRKDHTTRLFHKFPQYSRSKNVTIMHVYFTVDSTYPRLRKEMMSTVALISNAGGLLGLCMGFSMLSLLEIVYHATLRLLCKSYRQRSNRQNTTSGASNLNERKLSTGWNNNDDVMHPVMFHDEKNVNNGFLRKLFQRSLMLSKTSVRDDKMSNFNNSTVVANSVKHHDNLPIFLRTPFESDFHKPYLATLWETREPSPEVGDAGRDRIY